MQSQQNPECLYPQPVWPQGNNGNQLTGTLIQGTNNNQLNATTPDNVFQWELQRNIFAPDTGGQNGLQQDPSPMPTGLIVLPTGFYSQTGTNTIANALANALNNEVAPLVGTYITNFQGTMIPTGTSQAIQLTATTTAALIPDFPTGDYAQEAANGLQIWATGTPGTLQKMANGCPEPIMLIGTYIDGTTSSVATGTFGGTPPTVSGNPVQRCGVNTQASVPDFDFYPDINDPQTRSNQFKTSGLKTSDGSSNQGQPPWVFVPSNGSNPSTLPENICSNQNGLADGSPGSEGLTYLKPIAGQCAVRPNQDVCQNPCIRDPNTGQLKPNPQTSQCRVFAGLSDANTDQCPTVCPQQCVEFWESCPLGTGLLTTLQNTQDDTDVLSLQGPTLNDGSPNPQFPTLRNGTDPTLGPWPNPNRPQKECQAAGSNFCSLALGNLQTQPTGNPICAAPCANGFQNINAFCTGDNIGKYPQLCTAGPFNQWDASSKLLGPFYNGAQICVPINPTPNIVCDPNQFTPYQGQMTGHQNTIQGCATTPIQILTGTTCTTNQNTWVNELFSVELCTNQCGTNQVSDVTQTSCVSSCSGAVWDSSEVFLQQWDQYDYYLTTGKCAPGAPGCSAANQPGACPQQAQPPLNSSDLVNSVKNHGQTIGGKRVHSKVLGSSLQNELPQNSSSMSKKQQEALRKQILDDQAKTLGDSSGASNQFDLAACPEGMEFISVPQNGEIPGLCQDMCQPGFKPVRQCTSGPTDQTVAAEDDPSKCPAADTRFACLADCPPNWDVDNRNPITPNCTQRYPGLDKHKFPKDPSLWVTCPEDGRFTIQSQTNTALPTIITKNGVEQGPPMCVRNTQPRLSTCPTNQQENPQNQQCTKLCGENDIVVFGPSGTICARACSNDGRFYQQQESLFDPNIDPAQVNRYCQRLTVQAGSGSDPNTIPTPQETTRTNTLLIVGGIILVVTIQLIQSYFTRDIRK